MTKMKSKKMTKSTFAVIIMAVLMVAMLAFGGTYAYFTATAKDHVATTKTGVITVKSNAGQSVVALVKQNVLPTESLFTTTGDDKDSLVLTATGTTRDMYVFVTISAKATKGADENKKTVNLGLDIDPVQGSKLTALTTGSGETLAPVKDGANDVYYYKVTTEDGAILTNETVDIVSCFTVTLDDEADYDEVTGEPDKMGADVVITVTADAIQTVIAGAEADANAAWFALQAQRSAT